MQEFYRNPIILYMKHNFILFRKYIFLLSLAGIMTQCQSPGNKELPPDEQLFLNPEAKYKAYAGIGMNLAETNTENAKAQIKHCYDWGFGGVFICASNANKGNLPEEYVTQAKPFMLFGDKGMIYLDNDYIKVYKAYLEEAKKLGMQVILYDDYFFPTGQVAGQFYQQFPNDMAARLDQVETNYNGSGILSLKIPNGTYLGAALMDMNNLTTKDVSELYSEGTVSCHVEKGNWKLMGFYLDHHAVLKIRNPGIINYIEQESVAKFLTISYDKFYKGFGEYFGNVIPMSFYDEPSLHWLDGRIWSKSLNDLYKKKYGESPIKYYPALWYDIGDQTSAARNAILGLRAEMYSVNFVKQIQDWCSRHNISLSGHMDQEELPNPVMANGDLMKVFEFQDIPGVDDVFRWGRSNPGYKIVTSASYNYDKPVTWAETYAAYHKIDKDIVYKVAMDQYAMGVNMQTPFPSEIEKFMSKDELKGFNQYIGRLSYVLQKGRHVSDVAVIYPIASAQAYNVFGEGWDYAYKGGKMPPEFDYLKVGEDLFRKLKIDFTYLHPEVMMKKCIIEKQRLLLQNQINKEVYQVLVIPGGNTIQASVAVKILEFFKKGGKIIATSKLPVFSAEFGMDEMVRLAMMEIFGIGANELMKNMPGNTGSYIKNSNKAGGMAFFIPMSNADILKEVFSICLPARDVQFADSDWGMGKPHRYLSELKPDSLERMKMQQSDYKGALTYIHKVKGGKNIYFFANSSEKPVETDVILRGDMKLDLWNPLDGVKYNIESTTSRVNGIACTVCPLKLPASFSVFLIEK